jgi:hypothetical protein
MASNNAYGPQIVTEGLVCNLDTSNSKSYPGAGTTWYDLSTKGNNAALTNAPVFGTDSTTGGNYFDFDGSSDYCLITTNTALNAMEVPTFIAWFYADAISAEGNLVSKEYAPRLLSARNSVSSGGMEVHYASSSYAQVNTDAIGMVAGRWYMMAGNVNAGGDVRLFVNGELVDLTAGAADGVYTNSENIGIGAKPGGTHFYNGKISIVQIYDRPLNHAEIKQNYNTHRSRFGL